MKSTEIGRIGSPAIAGAPKNPDERNLSFPSNPANTLPSFLDRDNISVDRGHLATTIAAVYFESTINWLIQNQIAGESKELNFCNVITLGVTYEDGELVPYIRPGEELKLEIKNDDENVAE